MIIEEEKLDHSFMALPTVIKFDKVLFEKIVKKIQKTKIEPFGKFYVFVLPHIFKELLKFLKEKNIEPKSIVTDNKMLRLEF